MFPSGTPMGINPEFLYGATNPQMQSRLVTSLIQQIIEDCQQKFPNVPVSMSSMDFDGLQVEFTSTRFGLAIRTNQTYMTNKSICETSLCDRNTNEKLYDTLLGLK